MVVRVLGLFIAMFAASPAIAQGPGPSPVDLVWIAEEGVYRATDLPGAAYVVTVVRE